MEETLKTQSTVTVDRSSFKPPRQNRTERVAMISSQTRSAGQTKELMIKQRPSSATRKLIMAPDTETQESKR